MPKTNHAPPAKLKTDTRGLCPGGGMYLNTYFYYIFELVQT
jgi:hypothetical protein